MIRKFRFSSAWCRIFTIFYFIVASVNSQYTEIPSFDFNGNDIASVGSQSNAQSDCENDVTCVGYNSAGYYKNNLLSPDRNSKINFFFYSVGYVNQLPTNSNGILSNNLQFFELINWNSGGSDFAGNPYYASSPDECAFLCLMGAGGTLLNGQSCVGSVYQPSTGNCWLKYYLQQPSTYNGLNILIPIGPAGCQPGISCTSASNYPFTPLPNFDFGGNDIASTGSMFQAAYSCINDQTCIGFNSNGFYKNGIVNAQISSLMFQVPVVNGNSLFVILPGWDTPGSNLYAYYVDSSPDSCAYACRQTVGCVGATLIANVPQTTNQFTYSCYLKSYFVQPNANSLVAMLLPMGTNNCPGGSTLMGSITCGLCNAGQVSMYGGGCQNCPAGQTSSNGGLCLPCPGGYTSIAGGSCTPCPAGQYSTSGASSCTNCPNGYISYSAGSPSCDNPIPFNTIQNFDLCSGGIYAGSLTQAEAYCASQATCLAFNSNGYYRNDYSTPWAAPYGFNSYVHPVAYGMPFIQLIGWAVNGFDLCETGPCAVANPAACAHLCTVMSGCVGALSDGGTNCWPKLSFSAPVQWSTTNILLPAGPGGCPINVINAGNCIYPIPYTMLPSFEFSGNDFGVDSTVDYAQSDCNGNYYCVGFNSYGWYKYDLMNYNFNTPINFFVHQPFYGMQFLQLVGMVTYGIDMPGNPLVLSSASQCTYQCTLTLGCMGAVWQISNNNCFLRSSFLAPAPNSAYNILIPAGKGGCPVDVISAGNCIYPIPYTAIPGIDFPQNDLGDLPTVDQAKIACDANPTCVAFTNDPGWYKFSLGLPTPASINFYVHQVTFSMQFVQIVGWYSPGMLLPLSSSLFIQNPSECAYYCTITVGCAGVVWELNPRTCLLMSSFSNPYQNSNYNWLLPVGPGGCPSSLVTAGNCITPTPICTAYLTGASLMSLLFQAQSNFLQLSQAFTSNPLNQDYINNGASYLTSFLNTEVDFNGDGIITTQEAMQALNYRSVNATGLSTNFAVWNCLNNFNGCNSTAVYKTRMYNDSFNCFLNSPKHYFDCSGVSIINNLQSQFPLSDDNTVCESSDQSWRPNSYQKPFTNWTYTPSSTPTGQSNIGSNGKVCVYTNGYNIQGDPFNTDSIAEGIESGFQDPNNNGITSYRRIYCIAVTLNNGAYSYECTMGLFHVSNNTFHSYCCHY